LLEALPLGLQRLVDRLVDRLAAFPDRLAPLARPLPRLPAFLGRRRGVVGFILVGREVAGSLELARAAAIGLVRGVGIVMVAGRVFGPVRGLLMVVVCGVDVMAAAHVF